MLEITDPIKTIGDIDPWVGTTVKFKGQDYSLRYEWKNEAVRIRPSLLARAYLAIPKDKGSSPSKFVIKLPSLQGVTTYAEAQEIVERTKVLFNVEIDAARRLGDVSVVAEIIAASCNGQGGEEGVAVMM